MNLDSPSLDDAAQLPQASRLASGKSRRPMAYAADVTDSQQLTLWDSMQNWRFAKAPRRFLIVRHPAKKPFFYDILLRWLETYFPEIRALFELASLPCKVADLSQYVLHVPWLQDPVQNWSQDAYDLACQFAARCDEQRIPIINRVDRLLNATKCEGARRIGAAGVRTAKMFRITNNAEFQESRFGLKLPLIIREEWGHGGKYELVESTDQLKHVQMEQFVRPIAVEYIEVKSPKDTLYRKYRYVIAGGVGVPQSMHACRAWRAKGYHAEFSHELRDEEISFCKTPNPHHHLFVEACKALELDFVAFDYSYDQNGRLVVWEANPYPLLHFPGGGYAYRRAGTLRVLAAMVKLYMERGNLRLPNEINEIALGNKAL